MRILACKKGSDCPLKTLSGENKCQSCNLYFPVEGILMGEDVFCYQCRNDSYEYFNKECNACINQSNFKPTAEKRREVNRVILNMDFSEYGKRISAYMEQHPGATLAEARGHGKK